jgi:hypothetical protein
MGNSHWNDENLLALMYGIAQPDAHLDGCPDCRARWKRMRTRRTEVLDAAAKARVPDTMLREQRENIAARIERGAAEPGWRWRRAVPGLAVAAVLILGIALEKPGPSPEPVAAADARLFEEVFSEASRPEPRAVAPLRGLFEVRP